MNYLAEWLERTKMAIQLPEKCLRNLTNCQPLAQIVSDDGTSFFCCGHNDGSDREVSCDKFTLCFKNEAIDEMGHWCERDIKDQMSVMAQALSVDENMKNNE